MPQRRKCSSVRALSRLAVGKTTVPSPCSTSAHGTPCAPSSIASDSPAGPAPTIRTGTGASARGRSVCSTPRLLGSLDDRLGPQRHDLGRRIAERAEHLVGVLPQQR